MEPFLLTADSFAVLQKNTNPSLYYAAAPVIRFKEGVRSYTINFTLQGVECYIKSFLAVLVHNTAGVTVFEKDLDDRINKIPAGKLSKGFYFIRVMYKDKRVETLRLVVY